MQVSENVFGGSWAAKGWTQHRTPNRTRIPPSQAFFPCELRQWPGRPGTPRTVRHQLPTHNLTSELGEGAALAVKEPRVPGTALISEWSQGPTHKAASPWLTTARSPLEIPCALWIRNPMISFCCGPHKSWGPPGQESGLG